MDNYKRVAMEVDTYDALVKMARENGRTISGQLRLMVEAFETMHIKSVADLPHPADANPVPVVTVGK